MVLFPSTFTSPLTLTLIRTGTTVPPLKSLPSEPYSGLSAPKGLFSPGGTSVMTSVERSSSIDPRRDFRRAIRGPSYSHFSHLLELVIYNTALWDHTRHDDSSVAVYKHLYVLGWGTAHFDHDSDRNLRPPFK